MKDKGKVYHICRTSDYDDISSITSRLEPGDIVYIEGDCVYTCGRQSINFSRPGLNDEPITIIGIIKNGKRPIIKSTMTAPRSSVITVTGAHYILENLEIVGNIKEQIEYFNGDGDKDKAFFRDKTITYENLSQLYPLISDNPYFRIPEGYPELKSQLSKRATYRGVYHAADDLVIRNCVFHDCGNGILSADIGSGSITVERCEFYHNGSRDGQHNLYIQTDESVYPQATLKISFCHIHHSLTGNGLKSRATRNEIYYNLLRDNCQNQLELCGPDSGTNDEGYQYNTQKKSNNPCYDFEDHVRNDSDVVGNLIISRNTTSIRIGGDQPGSRSWGRFRIVGNTVVNFANAGAVTQAIRHNTGVESVEIYNNIFYVRDGGMMLYYEEPGVEWPEVKALWASKKRQIKGSHNFINSGFISIPEELENTIQAEEPGFISLKTMNFWLREDSPCNGCGTSVTLAYWSDWEVEWAPTRKWQGNIYEEPELYGRQKSRYTNRDNAFSRPLLNPGYNALSHDQAKELSSFVPIRKNPYTHIIGAFAALPVKHGLEGKNHVYS